MSISTFIKNFNEFMNDEEPMGRNEDFSGMDWWEPLKAMLRGKHNMELLGRGHFSAAFTHPEDETKVIKIGFKKEDAGAAYAAFCRQNQGLYGIPNVYHIQRLSKAYIVILDRLEDYRHFDGYQNISDQYREAGTIIEGGRPKNILKPSHSIMEAAFRIRDFFKDIASFDIHNENIMVKVDEQGSPIELVITDPVSYTCDNKAVEELMTQVLQTQEKEHKNIEPTKTKLSTKLLPTRFLPTTKLLPNKLDIKPDVLKEFLNQVDKPRIHEMAWDCLRIKPLPPEVIKVFHGEQTIQLPKIKLKSNIA